MKTPTMKKCGKCRETKSVDEFYNQASKDDGKQSECKACAKEYKAQRKAKLLRDGYKVITEKKCASCCKVKPADEFSRNPYSDDGKDSRCKACKKERDAQRKANLQRDGYKVITEKRCSKCGETKSADGFYKDARSDDGKASHCKACEKERIAQLKVKLLRDGYKVITEKRCSKCGETKPADEFGNSARGTDGKASHCKACNKEYDTQRPAKHQKRGYNIITEKKCSMCGEIKPAKEFSKSARDTDGKQGRCKACNKEYKAQPHVKARTNERSRERYKNDPQYKIACILRGNLRRVLKGEAKTESALALVGCTTEQLWEHLENSFVDGMTVQNHGEVWHVGHIECLSGFDGTNEEHIKRVNHFSNLKAQFKEENLSDGAKVPDNHQAGLPLWYD